MAESRELDCWEDLEQMTLKPPPIAKPPLPTHASDKRSVEVETYESKVKQEELPGESIDQALREALKNPRERANVLRIDADVFKFISDKTRCTIDFSYDLTSYQRLLAHRVSQMYGLQTSSVPAGNGQSRVIAHKTQDTKPPPVRVVDVMDVYCPPEVAKKAAPPEMTIKRRQDGTAGGMGVDGSGDPLQFNSAGSNRSVKQREEEYREARDRILGDSQYGEQDEQKSREDGEEDGKNTKAVFRDRLRELQDPDYRRDATKGYQKQPVYTPSTFATERGPFLADSKGGTAGGVYTAPTYHSEFPALPVGTGAMSQPRAYPPAGQHVYMSPIEQQIPTGGKPGYAPQAPALSYPLVTSAMARGGMRAVQYPPPPMGNYAFSIRPSQFRMPGEPMTAAVPGSTQPMIPQGWKQPRQFPVPPVTTPPATATAAPPGIPPPQQNFPAVYGGYPPPYQTYGGYMAYQARSPYLSVVQGNQQRPHGVPTDTSGHMHQMTTIQRKPVGNSQNDGVQQSGR